MPETPTTNSLSPDNEAFLKAELASGVYRDRDEAINDAVELLRQRKHLVEAIDVGVRQMDEGQYSQHETSDVQRLSHEAKREARRRREARNNGS